MAKAPSQPDLSRSGPGFQPQAPRQDQTRSAGSSPSRQPPPPEQPFGKLFGFGASLLNQASSLISVDPVQTTPPAQPPSSPKPPQKQPGPPGPGPGPGPAAGVKPAAQPVPSRQEVSAKPKVSCPLCKTELNIGDPAKTPNYNVCTQCHTQVCNMCGFNPTPHLTETCDEASRGPLQNPRHICHIFIYISQRKLGLNNIGTACGLDGRNTIRVTDTYCNCNTTNIP
ncbi:hypothetical protein PO909_020215 [Leuciscus waleckii]